MFVKGQLTITVPSLIFYETLNALRFSGVYNQEELEMAADSMSKYGIRNLSADRRRVQTDWSYQPQ